MAAAASQHLPRAIPCWSGCCPAGWRAGAVALAPHCETGQCPPVACQLSRMHQHQAAWLRAATETCCVHFFTAAPAAASRTSRGFGVVVMILCPRRKRGLKERAQNLAAGQEAPSAPLEADPTPPSASCPAKETLPAGFTHTPTQRHPVTVTVTAEHGTACGAATTREPRRVCFSCAGTGSRRGSAS